ncbi:MAG: hypothetical protein ACOC0P_05605 [Planctomycetota bacterium]
MSSPRMPLVPASVGDVIDRLTILHLKQKHIPADDARRTHVDTECGHLERALVEQCGFRMNTLFEDTAVQELAEVNGKLWDVEDGIRDCLKAEKFDEYFVDLARSVPILNDRRSTLKYRINETFGSALVEVKSYEGFEIKTLQPQPEAE